jgi:hypothetical protein
LFLYTLLKDNFGENPVTTTNQDKPFTPGERIEFCDEHYLVVANHGTSGTVRELGTNGQRISPFYWSFQGAECRRVAAVTA